MKIRINYGSGDFTRATLYKPATKEMAMQNLHCGTKVVLAIPGRS